MAKPRRSGGGSGVRRWRPADPLLEGELLQEWVEGVPASLVFVADGHDAAALGVTRQLIGDAAFGATGHRWCGNLLGSAGAPVLDAQAEVIASATAAAQALTRAFGLRGINGIDFIARQRRGGRDRGESALDGGGGAGRALARHVPLRGSCRGQRGRCRCAVSARSRGVVGKAVVFAPADCTMPDTDPWLADDMIRDVPMSGTLVPRGAPICTVFATGETAGACYGALAERARAIVQASLA